MSADIAERIARLRRDAATHATVAPAYADDLRALLADYDEERAAREREWTKGRDAEADRDAQRTRAEAAEAEVARLRSLIDVTARDLVAAKASAEGWREEATGLRAIVEGRTTAPTMAEWAAHDGEWDVLIDFAATPWCRAHRSRATISGPAGPALIQEGTPVRWWPVDDERRLCPWPVLA